MKPMQQTTTPYIKWRLAQGLLEIIRWRLEYIERARIVSDRFGLNKNWECNYLKLNIFQDDPSFSLNELDQLSEELLGVQFSDPLHELSR